MLLRLLQEARALLFESKRRIAIFDFDGTLFKSPQPPPGWPQNRWWRDPESLHPPCVPEHPDASWWNAPLVSLAKKRIADPSTHTVLLTGRWSRVFEPRIRELLHQVGLHFDETLLASSPGTLAFKSGVISQIGKRFDLESVEVWDDHAEHTRVFRSLFGPDVDLSINDTETLSREAECPSPVREAKELSAAVVVEKDGEVLLLRRGSGAPWMPGKWNLPGGSVDPGETPQRAAAREAKEEAGIHVGSMKLLSKVDLGPGVGDVFFFHTTSFSGTPKHNWESSDMRWVDKKEALGYDLVPGVGSALAKLR